MKPIHHNGTAYYLSYDEDSRQKFLCIEGDTAGFHGEFWAGSYRCPLTSENIATLRERLPWLKPKPMGLATSFGFNTDWAWLLKDTSRRAGNWHCSDLRPAICT